MNQALFLYLKVGIVALAVAGVFVLAALGKLDASGAMTGVVTLVTGLVVALGISASGSARADAMKVAAGVAPDATIPVKAASLPPRPPVST